MQSRIFRTGWKFIDILFPPCCAGCGEWGERYCRTCVTNTQIISPNICQICGEPLGPSPGSICARCNNDTPFFTAVRSWSLFEDPLKKAIHKLKYQRNLGLGEVMARPMAKLLLDCDWDIDLITAVPLDKARELERGFNQSDILARPLSWLSNNSYRQDAIKRARNTRSQVGLSRDERIENMAEAFIGNPEIVNAKSVLVVDDVITTGSTLNACSKSLIKSGAKRVFGLTLARSVVL